MKILAALTPVPALLVAAVASSALAADLTIQFPAAAHQGRIMVALFDGAAAYGGQGAPARSVLMDAAAGQTSVTFDHLPDGDYAVRAFHDLNGDGEMNTNPFDMPIEPCAFSNNAVGNMGPAAWDRARFALTGAVVQSIDLK